LAVQLYQMHVSLCTVVITLDILFTLKLFAQFVHVRVYHRSILVVMESVQFTATELCCCCDYIILNVYSLFVNCIHI